ncbi:MAG: prepilin-type N-terminal cleavage/methylation domain-containing protein [bacterium]
MSIKEASFNRGFTLIEMATVIGLIAFLMSFSLFINLDNYKSDSFPGERDRLVTLLQTARADSLNNIDQISHGVAIRPSEYPGSYAYYEGVNYSDALSQHPESINPVAIQYAFDVTNSSPKEIVFYQLSGDAHSGDGGPYDGDITLNDAGRNMQFNISINHEGRIDW